MTDENKTKQRSQNHLSITSIHEWINSHGKFNGLSILIAVISIATAVIVVVDECKSCFCQSEKTEQKIMTSQNFKKYWVYSKNLESGHLKHVLVVLKRLGYENDSNTTNWDLLWAHDYPFRQLYSQLKDLKAHQKVNHFPGCGYITNKVDLSVTELKYIPKSFRLPQDRFKFLTYAKVHPNASFVQKNNDHRNIKVKAVSEINLDSEGTFLQEFIDKPLLVSGFKFDIGIYTIISSIDPLRIYIYNGDVLLRFCPVKYYPFDSANLDKYVVGDDYLPIWEVPELEYYYNNLGYNMKESLNVYLQKKDIDSKKIWEQIENCIKLLILVKEPKILDIVNKFKSKSNFFELMRFDFVVDEMLNVYLLEANMSPNLSSAHYPANQLLYEQVLYNVLSLVGLGERVRKDSLEIRSLEEEEMIVSNKNLAVFPKECSSSLCKSSCISPVCHLCIFCLSSDTIENLKQAYKEHINRGDCKRIFPPSGQKVIVDDLDQLSIQNQLQYKWFQGKCEQDISWC